MTCLTMFTLNRLAVVLWLGSATNALAQSTTKIPVIPLTNVVKTPRGGYFSDPYPVSLPQFNQVPPFQIFSGTTDAILACPGMIDVNCITLETLTLDPGPLAVQAAAAGASFGKSTNHNIYLAPDGQLQMAATYFITNQSVPHTGNWTVIVHAHMSDPLNPLSWVADSLLVGSFSQFARANYDGKYFLDGDALYLVYSRNLSEAPVHDGIVAQRMISFTHSLSTGPMTRAFLRERSHQSFQTSRNR